MMSREIRDFSDEYSFLNSWYPAKVKYMGLEYTNAEAAFLAQKCKDVISRYKFCGLGPIDAELVLCQEKVQIKHAFFKVGLPCQSFCFFV